MAVETEVSWKGTQDRYKRMQQLGAEPRYTTREKHDMVVKAFAHMFEAQFDEIRYEEMKKYFPESLMYFEKKLEEIVI